jgi:hypothetical protein
MEERANTGVKGFFSDYGKGRPTKGKRVEVEQPVAANAQAIDMPARTERKKKSRGVRARTGRPPGVPNGSRSQKLKATMHINGALLDYYRDWSWEARCNLGELIERAMVAYKATRNRRGSTNTRRI